MDDYAHHPTAIRATLRGLREFYAGRRVIVSFMSHTYSRTAALLEEFAAAFDDADIVILHKIYASAREQETDGASDFTLDEEFYKKTCLAKKTMDGTQNVYYFKEAVDAAPMLKKLLHEGDLFITMGAGDNWVLGRDIYESF
jgi:UDP-N-acetylmuramate--alanine ligase